MILTVSDGIYSINPGGLQADLMPPGKKYPMKIPYKNTL